MLREHAGHRVLPGGQRRPGHRQEHLLQRPLHGRHLEHVDPGGDQLPGQLRDQPAGSACTCSASPATTSTASSPATRIATASARSSGSARSSTAVAPRSSATVALGQQPAAGDHADPVADLLHLGRAGGWRAARSARRRRGRPAAPACRPCRPGRGRWSARRAPAGRGRPAARRPRRGAASCRASTACTGRRPGRRRSTRSSTRVDPAVVQAAVAGQHPQVVPAGEVGVEARALDQRADPGDRAGSPGGSPSTVAAPAVGRTRPSSIRSVVVLPAPFGPRKPYTSPRRTVRLTASTASRSP